MSIDTPWGLLLPVYKFITEILIWVFYPFVKIAGFFRPEVGDGLDERIGRIKKDKAAPAKQRTVFCCASVGEVTTAAPFIWNWIETHPDESIVIAVNTPTGRRHAARNFAADATICMRPLDIGQSCARWLDYFKPTRLILIETELWPVFLTEALEREIPIHLINGRISNRSIHGYRRWKYLFRPLLAQFRSLAVQNELYRDRFVELGADPKKIALTGNLKYAALQTPPRAGEDFQALMEAFTKGNRLIVAGSTHAGEEKAILDAFTGLVELSPDLRLLIAPRHIDRLAEVEAEVQASGFPYTYRSRAFVENIADLPIVIMDTHGELATAYSYATVAFVGGSLVPVGGHNILEPVYFGVPVLYGPFIDNFAEEVEMVDGAGAGAVVADAHSMAVVLHELLEEPDRRKKMGDAGQKVLAEAGAVLDLTIRSVDQSL